MNKKIAITSAMLAMTTSAGAENVTGVDKMICAAGQAQICFETGECFAATPYELQVPDFILIDTKKRTVSTTRSSGANRSSEFAHLKREDGLISLQGFEGGRAFSFVIDELTGRLTAAIARDGLTITVFGACTDSNL